MAAEEGEEKEEEDDDDFKGYLLLGRGPEERPSCSGRLHWKSRSMMVAFQKSSGSYVSKASLSPFPAADYLFDLGDVSEQLHAVFGISKF